MQSLKAGFCQICKRFCQHCTVLTEIPEVWQNLQRIDQNCRGLAKITEVFKLMGRFFWKSCEFLFKELFLYKTLDHLTKYYICEVALILFCLWPMPCFFAGLQLIWEKLSIFDQCFAFYQLVHKPLQIWPNLCKFLPKLCKPLPLSSGIFSTLS